MPIQIGAISGGEVVDDHDVVAACEQSVDDVASEKTGAAGHEDTQLLAAPLPKRPHVCGRTGGGDGGQRTYAPLRVDASVSPSAVGFRRDAIAAEAPHSHSNACSR